MLGVSVANGGLSVSGRGHPCQACYYQSCCHYQFLTGEKRRKSAQTTLGSLAGAEVWSRAEEGSAGRREGPAWVNAWRLDLGGSEASGEPAPQASEVRPAFSSRHSGPKSPVGPAAQGTQTLPGPGMCFQSGLISDSDPEFLGQQGPCLREADRAQLLGSSLLHSRKALSSS